MYEIASESWGLGDDETRQSMSVMASAAAWGMGRWDSMEEYVRSIPSVSFEGYFYQTLLSIHCRQFSAAQVVCVHTHTHTHTHTYTRTHTHSHTHTHILSFPT